MNIYSRIVSNLPNICIKSSNYYRISKIMCNFAAANSYQLFSMRLSVPLMSIKSKLENGIYKIECCRSGSDD